MKCKKGIHDFEDVHRQGNDEEELVVKWCSDCGAIRIDCEFDGRVQAGYYKHTEFPTIAHNPKAYETTP